MCRFGSWGLGMEALIDSRFYFRAKDDEGFLRTRMIVILFIKRLKVFPSVQPT